LKEYFGDYVDYGDEYDFEEDYFEENKEEIQTQFVHDQNWFHNKAMRIIEEKGFLSVMMVSEKPSIAKTIAYAIGGKPNE